MTDRFILLTSKHNRIPCYVAADRIVMVTDLPTGTKLRIDDGTADGDALIVGESFWYVCRMLGGDDDNRTEEDAERAPFALLHPDVKSADEDR